MEYKLKADYHTHTKRSDGKGTVEENVKHAVEMGLDFVGITDHGPYHNRGSRCTIEEFKKTKKDLDNLKDKYKIKTFFGVETNLVSLKGEIDIKKEEAKMFDYLVLGGHRTPQNKNLIDIFTWKIRNFFPAGKRRIEKVTNAYLRAIEQNDKIKIIAHLNRYFRVNVKPIAELAAKKGIWIELNGKGVNFTQDEIDQILETGANFVISSDAHRPEHVGDPKVVWEFLKTHKIPKERIVNLR